MVQQKQHTLPKVLIDTDSIYYTIAHSMKNEYENGLSAELDKEAIKRMRAKIISIIKYLKASHFILFVGKNTTYRYIIYPEYKANRIRMDLIPHIRQLFIDNFKPTIVETIETDDAIKITYRYYTALGYDVTIAAEDKDYKQIEGKQLLPPTYYRKTFELLNKTKEEAFDSLIKQIIKGDTTDNIKGINGLGDVYASKLLSGERFKSKNNIIYDKQEEILNTTINEHTKKALITLYAYMETYSEEEGLYEFCKNTLLVYLLSNYNKFTIPKWRKITK